MYRCYKFPLPFRRIPPNIDMSMYIPCMLYQRLGKTSTNAHAQCTHTRKQTNKYKHPTLRHIHTLVRKELRFKHKDRDHRGIFSSHFFVAQFTRADVALRFISSTIYTYTRNQQQSLLLLLLLFFSLCFVHLQSRIT